MLCFVVNNFVTRFVMGTFLVDSQSLISTVVVMNSCLIIGYIPMKYE
jgi:hypothetical protein